MQVIRRSPLPQVARRGFTLMEVLLVLAILGVIIGLVLPNLLGQQKKANIQATRVLINGVEQACKMYAIEHEGSHPSSLDVLVVSPGNDPKWKGPYLENATTAPADPWGSPIQYLYPGSRQTGDRPDIWSMGPDRQSGTDDDITNWSAPQ